MFRKNSLKKINNMIQLIIFIAMIGICIYYFFINKNIFKETKWLILWGLVGITNASSIINAKYFEDNFSWKHIWKNIIYVFISTIIVVVEIKKLWL